MNLSINATESYFLESYSDTDFIRCQKARVLTWIHICLVPAIFFYIIINILRNNTKELLGIIIVDSTFFVLLVTGMILIKIGKAWLAANLDIVLTMMLTTAGSILKLHVQISTGFNSFYLLLLCSLVFIAMFGNRKLLILSAVFYTCLIIGLHMYASRVVSNEIEFHLMSCTLNSMIALGMIVCLSYMNATITKTALQRTEEALEKNIQLNVILEKKVEKKTEEVKILKGFLPICTSCKKIRDDKGYWNQIENYIRTHSQADFSHSLCPECAKKLYPGIFKKG